MTSSDHKKAMPTRTEVLLDNYRECRQVGMDIAKSAFNDIAFSVGLLGAVISGGAITGDARVQLTLPFLIAGIAAYGVQKFRLTSLNTCYMIFLEREINKEYSPPVMIWNSEIIANNVSAGRRSKWGQTLLFFGMMVAAVLYGGVCYWAVAQNRMFLTHPSARLYLYIMFCFLAFLFSVVGIANTLSVIKRYTPEYIEELVRSGNGGFGAKKRAQLWRSGER
jgi:hypothetical protein